MFFLFISSVFKGVSITTGGTITNSLFLECENPIYCDNSALSVSVSYCCFGACFGYSMVRMVRGNSCTVEYSGFVNCNGSDSILSPRYRTRYEYIRYTSVSESSAYWFGTVLGATVEEEYKFNNHTSSYGRCVAGLDIGENMAPHNITFNDFVNLTGSGTICTYSTSGTFNGAYMNFINNRNDHLIGRYASRAGIFALSSCVFIGNTYQDYLYAKLTDCYEDNNGSIPALNSVPQATVCKLPSVEFTMQKDSSLLYVLVLAWFLSCAEM